MIEAESNRMASAEQKITHTVEEARLPAIEDIPREQQENVEIPTNV